MLALRSNAKLLASRQIRLSPSISPFPALSILPRHYSLYDFIPKKTFEVYANLSKKRKKRKKESDQYDLEKKTKIGAASYDPDILIIKQNIKHLGDMHSAWARDTPLSHKTKDEIVETYESDPEKWTTEALAHRFSVSQTTVMALLYFNEENKKVPLSPQEKRITEQLKVAEEVVLGSTDHEDPILLSQSKKGGFVPATVHEDFDRKKYYFDDVLDRKRKEKERSKLLKERMTPKFEPFPPELEPKYMKEGGLKAEELAVVPKKKKVYTPLLIVACDVAWRDQDRPMVFVHEDGTHVPASPELREKFHLWWKPPYRNTYTFDRHAYSPYKIPVQMMRPFRRLKYGNPDLKVADDDLLLPDNSSFELPNDLKKQLKSAPIELIDTPPPPKMFENFIKLPDKVFKKLFPHPDPQWQEKNKTKTSLTAKEKYERITYFWRLHVDSLMHGNGLLKLKKQLESEIKTENRAKKEHHQRKESLKSPEVLAKSAINEHGLAPNHEELDKEIEAMEKDYEKFTNRELDYIKAEEAQDEKDEIYEEELEREIKTLTGALPVDHIELLAERKQILTNPRKHFADKLGPNFESLPLVDQKAKLKQILSEEMDLLNRIDQDIEAEKDPPFKPSNNLKDEVKLVTDVDTYEHDVRMLSHNRLLEREFRDETLKEILGEDYPYIHDFMNVHADLEYPRPRIEILTATDDEEVGEDEVDDDIEVDLDHGPKRSRRITRGGGDYGKSDSDSRGRSRGSDSESESRRKSRFGKDNSGSESDTKQPARRYARDRGDGVSDNSESLGPSRRGNGPSS